MRLATLALLAATLTIAEPASAQDARRAQNAPAPTMERLAEPTPDGARFAGFQARQQMLETSLVARVPFTNIGPTVMSGRVTDIDADPRDPSRFYVTYASGGLWRTDNAGASFEPLFDDQRVMASGEVAVFWQGEPGEEIVWLGTGENNSSRSSYAGAGVFVSRDAGVTWEHAGLAETQRTGRIILHPTDPNTVWVAAAGALYHDDEHRGVYKTSDGGKTWRRTLFVDDMTGAIDLVADPSDPATLYAAMWTRSRRAWNFVEAGSGSGVHKSTDGGETWTRISTEASGLPTGAEVGRIGLSVSAANPSTVYALVDNQARRPDEPGDDDEMQGLTRDALLAMDSATFLALADSTLENYLRDNNFDGDIDADEARRRVRDEGLPVRAFVDYLEDANAQLFDTPVVGAEVYRSDDGGASWTRTHEDYLDNVYFSYGYYFGEIRVAPTDPDRVYIMGVPLLGSSDGGANFERIDAAHVHVDHQALWLHPTRPGLLISGNDGGLNLSYDDAETWTKLNTPAVGQCYTVQIDHAEPYNVYCGLQDNGTWVGPHDYEFSPRWYAEGDYPYDRLMGGDGMQVEVDRRDSDIVYSGYQFGNYFRIDRDSGKRSYIKPKHELGERPLRFNWQTPIHLSRHNQDILYFGSNKLHRSFDQGETWEAISGDLTLGGRAGDVPFGSLTTLDESTFRFGLIYAGSDDGLIHVTRDGGNTWAQITGGMPRGWWVSRVDASSHAEGRVYASLNGYRFDNFEAHVYRSDDYGQTWRRIGLDLPEEPVNVVLEDPHNADVVYVGTDHGLYASLDGGASFMPFAGGLPNVAVHDLKVQPEARHLLVGTHGRSVYRADIGPFEAMTPSLRAEPVHLFEAGDLRFSERWGESSASWAEAFEPEVALTMYARDAGTATLTVEDEGGEALRTMEIAVEPGLNYATYDVKDDAGEYLGAGTYTLRLRHAGGESTTPLKIEAPRKRGAPAPPKPGLLKGIG